MSGIRSDDSVCHTPGSLVDSTRGARPLLPGMRASSVGVRAATPRACDAAYKRASCHRRPRRRFRLRSRAVVAQPHGVRGAGGGEARVSDESCRARSPRHSGRRCPCASPPLLRSKSLTGRRPFAVQAETGAGWEAIPRRRGGGGRSTPGSRPPLSSRPASGRRVDGSGAPLRLAARHPRGDTLAVAAARLGPGTEIVVASRTRRTAAPAAAAASGGAGCGARATAGRPPAARTAGRRRRRALQHRRRRCDDARMRLASRPRRPTAP